MNHTTTTCNIKAWMALRKVTNGMVADRADVTREMVSYVINGKRVSAPVYSAIASLCRVKVADLLDGPESAGKRRAA